MPRVSVVIPNYNHGAFLRQRINSVVNQSFQDFEIILLDDCSADNSKEIIKNYVNHPKVSHIEFNTENSGSPIKQWQKGIELAKGEFVWIAESDDYADRLFLETAIQTIDKYPGVGLIYCQSNIVDEDGKVMRSNESWTSDIDGAKWSKIYIANGIKEIQTALSFKNTIPNASAVLMKRELFENDFSFPLNMKMLGDWMCWIKILKKTDVAFVPDPLNYFRVTLSSTRIHDSPNRKCHRVLEELQILNYLLEEHMLSKDDYRSRIRSMLAKRLKEMRLISVLKLCWFEIASSTKAAGSILIIKLLLKRVFNI